MVKALDGEAAYTARLMIQKLVELARTMQDDRKLAMALHTLGHSQLLANELDDAEKSFDESREVSSRHGDARASSISLAMLGFVELLRGRLEDALPRILDGAHGLAEDSEARAAILVRLAHVSKKFDKARFDAAVQAAGRGRSAELLAEVARAVETIRAAG